MAYPSQKFLQVIYGNDFLEHLSNISVLMIGVGGIGCELLKTMSPFKFKKIEILDLDKIEVSNLNRQFLFRNHHVGNSKAHVAKETISKMFPHMNIESHHANIFEPQYAINFFKKFDIVFMALDNAEARSYVNKLCMILDLPLLEAGTTGHKGQAMLIKKDLSRCYSCDPKPKPKSYPVCTIRTFPEKPIHCIIWGKHLFDLLFGPQEKENPLIDLIDSLKMHDTDDTQMAISVFNEMFYNQIMKVKDIEPEKFKYLAPIKIDAEEYGNVSEFSSKKISSQVEDIQSYVRAFVYGFKLLRKTKEKEGPIVFDKDDTIPMKLVSAVSNIRAHVFNIPLQSEFTIKEMAGNIVPTIASTNAIVAAIQVTEAIKYLHADFLTKRNQPTSHIKNKELYVQNTRTTKIIEASLGKANPACLVCNDNFLPHIVFTNFENTLKDFINHLTQKDPELKEFTITNTKGGEIYETSEDIDEDEDEKERNANNAEKTLAHWFGTSQGEIVLNNDTTGGVEKYLLSNETTMLLREFRFKERAQAEGKPTQLNEEMITKMMNDKAHDIAVKKVEAYHKAKEAEEMQVEETNGDHPQKPAANDGMVVLEDDDDDEIMFVETDKKELTGKRELVGEDTHEDEVGPGKKVKLD